MYRLEEFLRRSRRESITARCEHCDQELHLTIEELKQQYLNHHIVPRYFTKYHVCKPLQAYVAPEDKSASPAGVFQGKARFDTNNFLEA